MLFVVCVLCISYFQYVTDSNLSVSRMLSRPFFYHLCLSAACSQSYALALSLHFLCALFSLLLLSSLSRSVSKLIHTFEHTHTRAHTANADQNHQKRQVQCKFVYSWMRANVSIDCVCVLVLCPFSIFYQWIHIWILFILANTVDSFSSFSTEHTIVYFSDKKTTF